MKCGCGKRPKSSQRDSKLYYGGLYKLKQNLRFSDTEILELKERYDRMVPAGEKYINKESFCDKMGLLSYDCGKLLSNRIFEVIDTNKDDILIYGEQEEKVELTFQMIDIKRKGWFSYDEFSQLIISILSAWNDITGTQLNLADNQMLKNQIKTVFHKFDLSGDGNINLQNFKAAVFKEPHLLEIFDYVSQGFQESMNPFEIPPQFKELGVDIENLQRKLNAIQELFDESPGEEGEGEKNAVEEVEAPSIPKRLQLILDSNINTNTNKSLNTKELLCFPGPKVTGESTPAVKKILCIHRTTFFQPILSASLPPGTSPKKNHPSKFEYFRFDQGISEQKNYWTPVIKNSKLPGGVKEDVGMKEILEEMEKAQNDLRNVRQTSKKIQPVIIEEDPNDLIDNCVTEEGIESQIIGSKPRIATISGQRKIELHSSSKKFDCLPLETIESQSLSPIEKPQTDPDLIKVSAKEYFSMKDRISQIKEKIAEITTDTHRLSEIIEVIHKEKPQNKKKQKENNELEYMKLLTSRNVPASKAIVFIGHKDWNLALNMMVGLEMAIKSIMSFTNYEIEPKDFKLTQYFQIVPKFGRNPTNFKLCTFYDYAPHVFNEIRQLYGIKNPEYLQSIGPEAMLNNWINGNITGLTELISSGKSGSFFYYTADGQYIIKTVKKAEFVFLLKILKSYYNHLVQNPQTMIIKYPVCFDYLLSTNHGRFFGCHKLKLRKEGSSRRFETSYITVMCNVFNTIKEIHLRYDLKGSTLGRKTNTDDPTVAKKDLDFIEKGEKLKLAATQIPVFLDQLRKDANFFAQNNIIDYSLLVGVHYLNQKEDYHLNKVKVNQIGGINQQAFAEWLLIQEAIHKGGSLSYDGEKIYYFGIIDILTEFSTKKKLEYGLKSVIHRSEFSAIPPAKYASRFLNFIISNVSTSVANLNN